MQLVTWIHQQSERLMFGRTDWASVWAAIRSRRRNDQLSVIVVGGDRSNDEPLESEEEALSQTSPSLQLRAHCEEQKRREMEKGNLQLDPFSCSVAWWLSFRTFAWPAIRNCWTCRTRAVFWFKNFVLKVSLKSFNLKLLRKVLTQKFSVKPATVRPANSENFSPKSTRSFYFHQRIQQL